MSDDRTIRTAARVLALAAAVVVGVIAFVRAAKLDFDFHHFYLDARYVWEHGALNPNLDEGAPESRRQLPFYLPVVPLLLAPLAAGGPLAAAALWALVQAGCAGFVVLRVGGWWNGVGGMNKGECRMQNAECRTGHQRHVAAPLMDALRSAFCILHSSFRRRTQRSDATAWVLIGAVLLVAPAVYEAARFNQLSFALLAILLLALERLERGRAMAAGALVGLAAVVKLLPAVFLVWLALKRQWTALAAGLVSIALLALAPCLIAFGPQRTAEYHQQWWAYNVGGAAARGMTDASLREHFIDHRNQSIPAVLARTFVADHPHANRWQPLQLDERTALGLAYLAAALLLGGLLWATRGRWPGARTAYDDGRTDDRLRVEFAAYLLAMLALSPLVRTYYLVWALPAVFLFVRRLSPGVAGQVSRAALIGTMAWALGMAAWLSPAARAYGVHLWMLVAMGVCLLAVGPVRRRNDGEQGSIAVSAVQNTVSHRRDADAPH